MFSVEKQNKTKKAQITAEITRYGIDILEISECKWSGLGRLKHQQAKPYYTLSGSTMYMRVGRSGNNHVKEGCSMRRRLEAGK